MPTLTIEEAQARLVAKRVGAPSEAPRLIFGRGRGKVIVVSEDDEHLEGFAE